MTNSSLKDLCLIEAGFPCYQVGAETQRERDTGKAPPTHRLHVWWARRPLTPSRAAVPASLLPADTDPDWFLRQLGIEKRVVEINGQQWTLTGKVLDKVKTDDDGNEFLRVDDKLIGLLEKENERREGNLDTICRLKAADPALAADPVPARWEAESQPIMRPWPAEGWRLNIAGVPADPAHVNERIAFARSDRVKEILGNEIKWDPEDLYGYARAFANSPIPTSESKSSWIRQPVEDPFPSRRCDWATR
jgi:hypothetical protein